MPKWSKDADWIPLDNAKAQVEFWKKDLAYAEAYLKYVQNFKNKKIANYNSILKIAVNDVAKSKKELAKAKAKLEESKKLE